MTADGMYQAEQDLLYGRSEPDHAPHQLTLLGHCATRGRPDQYHNACPVEITSSLGVRWRCSCPRHDEPESDDAPCPT
jgi:hypothetical protein